MRSRIHTALITFVCVFLCSGRYSSLAAQTPADKLFIGALPGTASQLEATGNPYPRGLPTNSNPFAFGTIYRLDATSTPYGALAVPQYGADPRFASAYDLAKYAGLNDNPRILRVDIDPIYNGFHGRITFSTTFLSGR